MKEIMVTGDAMLVDFLPMEYKDGFKSLDDVSKEGMIIPEKVKAKDMTRYFQQHPDRAKVIHAGPGRYLENGEWKESEFKVGDIVLVRSGGNMPVVIDGKLYYWIRPIDVMVVLRDK